MLERKIGGKKLSLIVAFFFFATRLLLHAGLTASRLEKSTVTSVFTTPAKEVFSPLQWQVWDSWLSGHHVKGFRDYIVNGVREDYRIGFDYQHPYLPSTSNLRSAGSHTAVIDEYLGAECAAGRVLGPFN